MPDITRITFNMTKNDEVCVKTQAIEVWASIAEEELSRQQRGAKMFKIIDMAFDSLLEILLFALQETNFYNENDDEPQWGSSVAAGCCLNLISQVLQDRVVEPITEFIARNLTKKNCEKRY